MGRTGIFSAHSTTVALIWFTSAVLFFFLFQMALHNSTSSSGCKSSCSCQCFVSKYRVLSSHIIEAEVAAVKSATEHMCRLKIVLDRVILTSTGVLLGCWQVISGTDPVTIRAKLRTALPHAPEKQLYDAAILHTSFARLLGHPKISQTLGRSSDELQPFHELVARLNKQIRGFEAVVSELWYVEEYDVLALALNGRMKVRKFPLGCYSS